MLDLISSTEMFQKMKIKVDISVDFDDFYSSKNIDKFTVSLFAVIVGFSF
jgi:hypothetical protein